MKQSPQVSHLSCKGFQRQIISDMPNCQRPTYLCILNPDPDIILQFALHLIPVFLMITSHLSACVSWYNLPKSSGERSKPRLTNTAGTLKEICCKESIRSAWQIYYIFWCVLLECHKSYKTKNYYFLHVSFNVVTWLLSFLFFPKCLFCFCTGN